MIPATPVAAEHAALPLGSEETQTQTQTESEATVAVGLVVAFAALVMTFGALLLAYGLVRVQAGRWPPEGETRLLGLIWPRVLAATVAAAVASGAVHSAVHSAHRNSRGRALLVATAAAWGFVVVQVWTARHLLALGARPSSGMVASVLFALGAFHALHALAAALLVSRLAVRAARGRVVRPATVRAAAAFVHLVTGLWLVIGLAVFVW